MKKILVFLIVCLILGVGYIYYLEHQKETWTGFYYPDGCRECKETQIVSPELETWRQCMAWFTDLALKRGDIGDAFDCGKNCKEDKNDVSTCTEVMTTSGWHPPY